MTSNSISPSPFSPHQPVAPDMFVGRRNALKRIRQRAVDTYCGDVRVVYINGVRGIGKSSLAYCSRQILEHKHRYIGFYVSFGGVAGRIGHEAFLHQMIHQISRQKIDDQHVLQAFLDRISRYVDQVSLPGLSISIAEPVLSTKETQSDAFGFLTFLSDLRSEVLSEEDKDVGFLLIVDEIDAVAREPYFANFLKDLSDRNTLSELNLPLLILICGTRERLRNLAENNSRAAQQLDLVDIHTLSDSEVQEFIEKAFTRARLALLPDALAVMVGFSHGMPQLMQLIGDQTYQIAPKDRSVTLEIACEGVRNAADALGEKFIESRVRAVIRTAAYREILERLCEKPVDLIFTRKELLERTGKDQEGQVDRFLRRFKELGVIERGDKKGEWRFADRLVSLYVQMNHSQTKLIEQR